MTVWVEGLQQSLTRGCEIWTLSYWTLCQYSHKNTLWTCFSKSSVLSTLVCDTPCPLSGIIIIIKNIGRLLSMFVLDSEMTNKGLNFFQIEKKIEDFCCAVILEFLLPCKPAPYSRIDIDQAYPSSMTSLKCNLLTVAVKSFSACSLQPQLGFTSTLMCWCTNRKGSTKCLWFCVMMSCLLGQWQFVMFHRHENTIVLSRGLFSHWAVSLKQPNDLAVKYNLQ